MMETMAGQMRCQTKPSSMSDLMASMTWLMGFQAFTVRSQSGIMASGTKAVDMKATGMNRKASMLVACSFLVTRAGAIDVPAQAPPDAPAGPGGRGGPGVAARG